ncbi:MAG TPA: hypothetical protein V6D23_06350 [Candidatus Obscuribacterales bacterium]
MLLSSQTTDFRGPADSQPGQPASPFTRNWTIEYQALPFTAGAARVLARFSPLDRARGQELIRRVLLIESAQAEELASQLLADFGCRHRELEPLLIYHFHQVLHLMPKARAAGLSQAQKLLIGAYFTQETAIEAGGLCCPGLVAAPTADGLIFYFQALGQDLGSSVVFREARFCPDLQLRPETSGSRLALPIVEEFPDRPRSEIEPMIRSLLSGGLSKQLLKHLPDPFVYSDLFQLVDQYRLNCPQPAERKALKQLLEAVDDYYDLHFVAASSLSERVLPPQLDHESRGLEDARFVRFSESPGRSTYYACYTANGQQNQPRLLQTDDFLQFRSYSLRVPSASQLALFPRRVKGRYAMLAQVDRFHHCLLFSDRLTQWQQPILLQEPSEPWEIAALGNCGSPIETPQGWLVISQGSGPMGSVGLSACLLDLQDPTRLKARLREPLPLGAWSSGKVSSAGSLLYQDRVLIPYALPHQPPAMMAIPLSELLARMQQEE